MSEESAIFWHGDASSAVEPGFQAIICLKDRPIKVPTSLGLRQLDSYRHQVFLQRTEGPNQMFGRWCDDEAQDKQEAAAAANDDDDDNPFKCNRRTLRLRLDDYLDYLAMLQDKWQTLESS
jgi:hypothetical protein